MKKGVGIGIILLLSLFLVSAYCEEGQIDINTASIQELDLLEGIGPAKAGNITIARPFDSVEDLMKVSGIKEATLAKIVAQGLACVQNQEVKKEVVEESPEEIILEEVVTEKIELIAKEEIPETKKEENVEQEVIKLTPQNIKSEENMEKTDKRNFIKYGFVVSSILLGILFIIKNKRYQNEFD